MYYLQFHFFRRSEYAAFPPVGPALNSVKSLQKPTLQDSPTCYSGVTQSKPDGIYQPQNTRELFCVPIIRAICLSGCALSFISTSFDVVFVLFCFSPVDLGGLGFSVRLFPFLKVKFKRRQGFLDLRDRVCACYLRSYGGFITGVLNASPFASLRSRSNVPLLCKDMAGRLFCIAISQYSSSTLYGLGHRKSGSFRCSNSLDIDCHGIMPSESGIPWIFVSPNNF